ncbi:hypothetical protein GCM10008018_04540 [Paenibacillus marchantiophytorum]|uniref:Uncharacterized protein n=1 Tax=Paenibacillus marchantiophytorum TaxID=1619310 RepID=A0ABQ2BNK1_9BACL|nr:hypothetical protein [Paenibacillus marchantiophytorum]GGI43922.1 hypothetical protein GCM10008018_04540 [Paenibacillus marchantiophytorum]
MDMHSRRYKLEFKRSLLRLFPLFVLCSFVSPEKTFLDVPGYPLNPNYVAGTVQQVVRGESETVLLVSVPEDLAVPKDLLRHYELSSNTRNVRLSQPVVSPANKGRNVELRFHAGMNQELTDFLGIPAVGEHVQSVAVPDRKGVYQARFLVKDTGDYIVAIK